LNVIDRVRKNVAAAEKTLPIASSLRMNRAKKHASAKTSTFTAVGMLRV
jgi:hypothetical protein